MVTNDRNIKEPEARPSKGLKCMPSTEAMSGEGIVDSVQDPRDVYRAISATNTFIACKSNSMSKCFALVRLSNDIGK